MTRFRYPAFYDTRDWQEWRENIWRILVQHRLDFRLNEGGPTLSQFAFYLLTERTSMRTPSVWCSLKSVR
jgi:hypothetical protein